MEKVLKKSTLLFSAICMIILGMLSVPKNIASAAPAAGPVRPVAVEYYEEQLVVWNNDNTRIYYANEDDAARNNWEVINADPGPYTMIDLSWLSPTVTTVVVIKGDVDKTPYYVTLAEKPLKLEVSINYANIDRLAPTDTIASLVNIMTTAGTASNPVTFDDLEWRKGLNGEWVSTRSLTKSMMDKMMVKGTYVYFRIRALDDVVAFSYDGDEIDLNEERLNRISGGIRKYDDPDLITFESAYPNGLNGRRFSNEVKVKIPKKAAPLAYGIDGSKFTAALKYGKEYRVTTYTEVEGGPDDIETSDWIQIIDKTVKTLPLATVVNQPGIDGTTEEKAFPEILIEVRDYATSKLASSKISEIGVRKQRTLSQALIQESKPTDAVPITNPNIYIYYSGDKYVIIRIPSASPDLQYEYCIKKPGEAFNIAKTSWTAIAKSGEVKISSSKALDGSTIYIRQREIKARVATSTSEAIEFQLASTYVTHTIEYPSMPIVEVKNLDYKRYYSDEPTFNIILNAAGKLPYETEIASIKLGTQAIEFTADYSETGGVETIEVTLTEAAMNKLAKCSKKPLTINFKNGTTNKSSIKLTVVFPTQASYLTIKATKGTENNTTTVKVETSLGKNNTWVYTIGDTEISGVNIEDTVSDLTALTPVVMATNTASNITVAAGKYITVYEVDTSGHILKYRCIQITQDMIFTAP